MLQDNYLVYSIIEKYSNLFGNGMGGISADGIRLALEAEYIPKHLYSDIIQGIVAYLVTSVNIRNESKN